MRFKKFIGLASIFCLFLSSCGKAEQTPTPVQIELTPSLAVSSTPLPAITPTPVPLMEAPGYTLNILLDYAQKQASVEETIKYQNQTGGALSSIVLAVEPNLWAGCFSLQAIKVNNNPFTAYTLDGQRLELTQTLDPMEIVTISILYTLDIPMIEVNDKATVIRTQVFGYTPRQINLVDWYPFIVPNIAGQGWLLNEPATYGEHLAYESADFDVTVRFADPAAAPVVAASGAETSATDGKRFLLQKGRSFALSFSPDYLVKSQVQDGVTVLSYYFPASALGGQAALDATLRALQVFSQDFGPYPHASLSIVQEETAFSMEYDGLYFLERPLYFGYSGADSDPLPTIAAHETAHQWWFGLVGTDQGNQPWLDEALATYSERLYIESYSLERGASWWYVWRINPAIDKDCPVDITIYGFYKYNCFYTESVYMRGGLFLQALRDRIGDPAFLAFLKDFATQYAHKIASTQDFFTVLRQHTDADLTGIIQAFFTEPH
jgi:hypothetical protein